MVEHLVMEEETADNKPANERERVVRHELESLTKHEDERDRPGAPSPYACPDCGGVLWEMKDGELLRFRCRVGHAYNTETLTAAQARAVEEAVWTALRALEEQAAVKKRVGERFRRQNQDAAADQMLRRAREIEQHAEHVRTLLLSGVGANEP
jgi:two-component system chemotaxis response regulator CheB